MDGLIITRFGLSRVPIVATHVSFLLLIIVEIVAHFLVRAQGIAKARLLGIREITREVIERCEIEALNL